MPGTQDLLGYGAAQVLPKPASMMPLVEQLNQQKQQKFIRDKYEQAQKEQDEKQLYGLVGDALNLRDFNPVIHDRVRKAQVELSQKFKAEKPSYGDAYMAAQNKAAELGLISQSLNQADQILAASKKEYEGDKRINTGNIEMLARQKILDELKKNGKIDPSINYFDEALNEYPEFALTDKGEFSQHRFLPEELLSGLSGGFKDINKRGGYEQKNWKVVGNLAPAFYDYKDNGEDALPTITVKSQDSGLVDSENKPIPMLSDEAYGRWSATPSNVVDINRRIKRKYGDNIGMRSKEAEILRKIEAYNDVEKTKPKIITTKVEKADPIRIYNSSGGSGSSKKEEPTWDLTEYPTVSGGGKDLTVPFQGYSVTAIGKEKLLAKQVIYNPSNKTFTVTEYAGRDKDGNPIGETTKTISAKTFRQNIQGMNPGTDMKPFDALVSDKTIINGSSNQSNKNETVAERMRRLAGQK